LILANLGLIFINRSWTRTLAESLRTPNAAARWVYGGGVAMLLLVLYVPPLRELFHFSALHIGDLAICLGAGLLSVLWFEGFKALRGRRGAARREYARRPHDAGAIK
jgi:P-type Ca2+ transporter type 2C